MVGGRVGFLVAGLSEGVRGIFENMIFDQLLFACCRSMSLHIFAATLAFLLFFGSWEVSHVTTAVAWRGTD